MTSARQSRPASARGAAISVAAGRQVRPASGLRITALTVTILLLVQIGVGIAIAQAVEVPAADSGAGIFPAIGRALANGPAAISVHATLGLLLSATAILAVILAARARRAAVLAICLAGLAALVGADITGARFTGSGHDSDSTAMMVSGIVAFACYALCWLLVRRRPSR